MKDSISNYDLMSKMNQHVDCHLCSARLLSTFKGLEPEFINRINEAKTTNLYRKGQVIFYEGNPAYGLFCINSGKIKLYKSTPEGKRFIVRISGPGDQLGYLALFGEQPYSATAEVLEDATICFIDRQTLYPFISKSKDTSIQFVKILARELALVQTRATEIAHRSIRERMAGLLLLLKERHGRKTKDGIFLDLPLSREDLAELAGTSKETAIRVISDFRKENLVKDEGHNIVLLSPKRLAEIAGFVD